MSGPYLFPKSERICSERVIDALFSNGRRGGAGPLRFCWAKTVASDSECNDTARSEEREVAAGVAVMFSVPKKLFKRAWKRNLIKRRMRESYRQRKHLLVEKAVSEGKHIEIAFIMGAGPGSRKGAETVRSSRKGAVQEIPDFKTIDNAIAKILEQIMARC